MGLNQTATVVVVDAYGGLASFVDELGRTGLDVLHVRREPTPACFVGRDRPRDVPEVVCREVSDAVEAMAGRTVGHVIAATEPNVEFAEALGSALGCPGNDAATSRWRRDKAAMHARLAEQHRAHIRSWRLSSPADFDRIAGELPRDVVSKPTDSLGNDAVSFHRLDSDTDRHDLRHHVEALWGRTDALGRDHGDVVIQERKSGHEYVVNTVSVAGQHLITDCWRYLKLQAPGGADRISTALSVAPADVPERVRTIAVEALDVLGVHHGAGHAEILDDPSGPVLVELGARPSGADTARFSRISMGRSQLDWLTTWCHAPDKVAAHAGELLPMQRHVAWYFCTSPVAGEFVRFPLAPQVEALESFAFFVPLIHPGEPLRVTVDETAEPAHIALVHADESIVWRDLMTVHHLDGASFYEVRQ